MSKLTVNERISAYEYALSRVKKTDRWGGYAGFICNSLFNWCVKADILSWYADFVNLRDLFPEFFAHELANKNEEVSWFSRDEAGINDRSRVLEACISMCNEQIKAGVDGV